MINFIFTKKVLIEKLIPFYFIYTMKFEEKNINNAEITEIIGDSKYPCFGYLTIPNNGDALGYICPVCMWEIDLFIKSKCFVYYNSTERLLFIGIK